MAKIDEVSSRIGELGAKVDVLVGMKDSYDKKIDSVEVKLDAIHDSLIAVNLPELKSKVESIEKRQDRQKWVMMGAAAGAGGLAGSTPTWIKTLLANIFT